MAASVTIGTRGSKLAKWQSEWVKSALEKEFTGLDVRLAVIKTRGDKILDVPLAKVGGKGLFVKEIETALLEKKIDLAVHSMKDMPAEIPEGLWIGAVPLRETPLDVLISKSGDPLDSLPAKARVGTSSLRRAAQLLNARPDLTIVSLRGNLDTRLKKLRSGNLDAIVLAAAGVKRLGLEDRITQFLDPAVMLPAVGQGALCIEARREDPVTAPLVKRLDHSESHTAILAERAFLHRLEGGCQVPMAGYAQIEGDALRLQGLVSNLDGSEMIRDRIRGPKTDARGIGIELAQRLLKRGAGEILETLSTQIGNMHER